MKSPLRVRFTSSRRSMVAVTPPCMKRLWRPTPATGRRQSRASIEGMPDCSPAKTRVSTWPKVGRSSNHGRMRMRAQARTSVAWRS
jgi:hypothetical protein